MILQQLYIKYPKKVTIYLASRVNQFIGDSREFQHSHLIRLAVRTTSSVFLRYRTKKKRKMAETRSRVLVLQGVTRAVRSDDEREKLYCHVVLLDTINERTDRKSHHCVPHHEACSDCIIQLHIQHPSRYSNVNARTYSIYIHICIPMHKDVIAKDALVA